MREFRIIVSQMKGVPNVAEMRCPECGSPELMMLNVIVSNGSTRSWSSHKAVLVQGVEEEAPFVRMPFCCGEGHCFDYTMTFGRGLSKVFVTHSIFEPTSAEGSTM